MFFLCINISFEIWVYNKYFGEFNIVFYFFIVVIKNKNKYIKINKENCKRKYLMGILYFGE